MDLVRLGLLHMAHHLAYSAPRAAEGREAIVAILPKVQFFAEFSTLDCEQSKANDERAPAAHGTEKVSTPNHGASSKTRIALCSFHGVSHGALR